MTQLSEKPKTQTINPERWVDDHGNYLYNFALGRLRNQTESENVVQETFLAALTAKDKFKGNSSERTWLIGILKHKIVDFMRKSYKEKPVTDLVQDNKAINDFFDQTVHFKKQPSGWLPNADELLEKEEFWKVFMQCCEKIPQTACAAFTLKEIDKVDTKEICDVLSITPANFWVLMHRARLQLRQCLEAKWFENE